MIPKIIYTVWIGEVPLPDKYKKACKSHDLKGYQHKLITLADALKFSTKHIYLHEAIKAKKWIKVADYLRMKFLCGFGGVYLDCDMEVIKPFDDLLDNKMFVGRENDHIIGNSAIGSEKGHPLLIKYLDLVQNNFRGDGEFIFEPAERLFGDLVNGHYGKVGPVTTYSEEYFFPFNEKGEGEVTENSHTIHGFTRSWK
jgi:mannosyltransferase OCH1-like enzyme